MSADAVLSTAKTYLSEEVAPNANTIDEDVDALREALGGLCQRELMALRRPEEFGGPDLGERDFREFQEMVARYSGSLAFLQTQHQSAVRMIGRGDNEGLKAEMLPHMGNGDLLCGIGFSQLRRPGEPIMKAEECGDGYRLNGQVPWVTGYGIYHQFLIGASLPDGRALFAPVPFSNTVQEDGGVIKFGEVMELAAMESPQTTQAELTDWHIPESKVAFIKPDGWIQNNDMINVTLQGFFALGCARAGLDIVEQNHTRRESAFIKDAFDRLDAEVEECREAMVDPAEALNERLRVRAWAIDLAVRCAHAAVATSSGFANSVRSNAQRVYREALVYTVSAQTSAIMEATLSRLVNRGEDA